MQHNGAVYVPVIKGKKNDLIALSRLADDTRSHLLPLVELMPVPPNVTVEDHIKKFVAYIAIHYPNGPLIVDMYGLAPGAQTSDGRSALFHAFRELRKTGRTFIPAYGFQRDDSVWPTMAKLVKAVDQGFAFRVDHDDLDDAAEDTWIQILNRLKDMALSPNAADIVIDLRDIGEEDADSVQGVVADFLSMQPLANDFRSIAVVGSSALKMVSSIPKDGMGLILRNELQIWLGLREQFAESLQIRYGDYGVIHPEFSDIGPSPNANAKIRYTSGLNIIYFRGHGLLRPVNDYGQYIGLAKRVQSHNEYRGAGFSFGDKYIASIATGFNRTGNLGTWVAADLNHHWELTTRQMIAIENIGTTTTEVEELNELLESI